MIVGEETLYYSGGQGQEYLIGKSGLYYIYVYYIDKREPIFDPMYDDSDGLGTWYYLSRKIEAIIHAMIEKAKDIKIIGIKSGDLDDDDYDFHYMDRDRHANFSLYFNARHSEEEKKQALDRMMEVFKELEKSWNFGIVIWSVFPKKDKSNYFYIKRGLV